MHKKEIKKQSIFKMDCFFIGIILFDEWKTGMIILLHLCTFQVIIPLRYILQVHHYKKV